MPIVERTTLDIREEIALAALGGRYTVTEVAAHFGVSRPTVRLWRERYRASGRRGLEDLSHAPLTCPHRTGEEIEALVLADRRKFGWGSKKILRRLQDADPDLVLPSRSAVDAILRRHGLIKAKPRRRTPSPSPFRHRYVPSEAGELMTIDHKGQFRTGDGRYCFPLTIAESISRSLLACEALASTRLDEAWPVIVRVFREYGLPRALHSDNGPPFGSPNGGLSTLSVRLMKIGVLPVFSRPGRPQDNGKHERMHRDLKAETTRPPASKRSEQQRKFDEFRHRYNVERPHEAIGQKRPSHLFSTTGRPYPRRIRNPEYPGHFEPRKVSGNGDITMQGRRIFIANALAGETIGLEPVDDQLFAVHFYSFGLGKVDTASNTFI